MSLIPLLCIALSLALALAGPTSAFAFTQSDADAHDKAAREAREAAEAQRGKASKLLDETHKLEDQIEALESEIDKLQGEIGTVAKRRERLEHEIDLLRASIQAKEQQIAAVQADYDVQTNALAARMDAQYRAGDWAYVQLLLGSEDLTDLIERTSFVQTIMDHDLAIADGLENTRIDLEKVKGDLDRDLSTVNTKRAEVANEERQLKALATSRDMVRDKQSAAKSAKIALISDTKKNAARLEAMADAEQAESDRIQDMLSGGSGNGHYSGRLAWPTPGYRRVSSRYGWRIHPISHKKKPHNGIDISVNGKDGVRIVAAGSGRVIFTGSRGGYGKCTMIDHGNGLVTLYAHQKKIATSVGKHVSKGQYIGIVGSTGYSTGNHLHFETRVNGAPRNPMNYL